MVTIKRLDPLDFVLIQAVLLLPESSVSKPLDQAARMLPT
jgi:hypothetical protein